MDPKNQQINLLCLTILGGMIFIGVCVLLIAGVSTETLVAGGLATVSTIVGVLGGVLQQTSVRSVAQSDIPALLRSVENHPNEKAEPATPHPASILSNEPTS
jgi:hypothetical protein